MDKVRIGIIGCGGIANQKHMPSLKKLPDVEITFQSILYAVALIVAIAGVLVALVKGWEAWKKMNPNREKAEHILRQLELWKQSARWTDDGGAYIPSPVNFLSADRGYLTATPPPQREAKNIVPKGASGELGAWELEAIQRVLRETEVE